MKQTVGKSYFQGGRKISSSPAADEEDAAEGGNVKISKLNVAVSSLLHLIKKKKKEEEARGGVYPSASSGRNQRREVVATVSSLFDSSEASSVYLLFSLQRTPEQNSVCPVHIELPNSLFGNVSRICLIVKSPQRKWKDLLEKEKIGDIQKIIDVNKLEKKFKTYRLKRELCSSFDLFLCDDRVVRKATALLGTFFIKNKKMPVGLKLRSSKCVEPIRNALNSTWMWIRSGPTVAVKVGLSSMKSEEIVQNANTVINSVTTFFKKPGKWENSIVSIHIQATNQPSLPLYSDMKLAERLRSAHTHAADTSKLSSAPRKKVVKK